MSALPARAGSNRTTSAEVFYGQRRARGVMRIYSDFHKYVTTIRSLITYS
jgi:hypothetical protein